MMMQRSIVTVVFVASCVAGCNESASVCDPSGLSVGSGHREPLLHGRVTTMRTSYGGSNYITDRPLEGATVYILDDPQKSTTTDEQGCFVLLGLEVQLEDYAVAVSLGADVYLGTVGMRLVKRQSGIYDHWPPVVDIQLPPLSLVQVPVEHPGPECDIALLYLAGDKVMSDTGYRSVVASGVQSFMDIGPGRYVLAARLRGGKKVYYPSADSLDEAMVFNVGFEPISLPKWDLRPF